MPDDHFLDRKLDERKGQNAFRQLRLPDDTTDFCSNDYLGIASNGLIETNSVGSANVGSATVATVTPASPLRHGSTGSRLLAGNYPLIEETEKTLASFHEAEAGLIFNSGYDANLGVLSCIPQRGDTILYDQLSHASIRDGIRLSFAQSFPFLHNDLVDLEKKLQAATGNTSSGHQPSGNIFVVTESVFSMVGDQAPLPAIVALCQQYAAKLIIDEAHATGFIGPKGAGLVQAQGLQKECLARIHTFGKAVGCHGAIVFGSQRLREYLINFSRAFIYTTALPPASIGAIRTAYHLFPGMDSQRYQLQQLINQFQQASLGYQRLVSHTPIQAVIVPGNEAVREVAAKLQAARLDVRPILYPTVAKGSERLRIVLHSFNTMEEIERLTTVLQ